MTTHPSLTTAAEVNTVRGTVLSDALGMTLTHEHLVVDWTKPVVPPEGEADRKMFDAPVDASKQWLINDSPACCLDNIHYDNPQEMAAEIANFVEAGGKTIVDCTNGVIGRDPLALRALSEQSGVNIIMGSGWYLHPYHDAEAQEGDIDGLCDELVAEFAEGVADTGIRPGIIGEIGVSPLFTDGERHRLRAAARAQRRLGVPMFIHLPGWQRRALEVLDIVVQQEQVAPQAVVLCHMDPSGEDVEYQREVAHSGVWMEFDMIGMPFFYAGEGQSPAPDQTAAAVARLVAAGHASQILLSHDLAAKSMWTKNGGNGIGYVPRSFLPRLERHGVSAEDTAAMVSRNPDMLFRAARVALA